MGFRGPEVQILSSRPVNVRVFGFSGNPFFMPKTCGVQIGVQNRKDSSYFKVNIYTGHLELLGMVRESRLIADIESQRLNNMYSMFNFLRGVGKLR
jgi:hypothetical protein